MRVGRTGLIGIALAIASPKLLHAQDKWTNPAGRNWSNGANWSTGSPPPPGEETVAQFSLDAAVPYTVLVDQTISSSNGHMPTFNVQNDEVVVNLNGQHVNQNQFTPVSPVVVSSQAGQTSSLTLANGSLETVVAPLVVGGTGGTSTLSLNSMSVTFPVEGGFFEFNGSAGCVTNYIQIGTTVSNYDTGLGFGATNTTINGGSDYSAGNGIGFYGNVSLTSTSIKSDEGDILFGGSALASGTSLVASYLFCLGTAPDEYQFGGNNGGYPATFPAGGGVSGVLQANGCTISAVGGMLIGCSGAIGRLTATACTINSGVIVQSPFQLPPENMLWVGIGGTGIAEFLGGTSLSTAQCYVGLNGGNGTIIVSGAGTNWSQTDGGTIVQNGLVQIDTDAEWTDLTGGMINLSGGTLSVLSGARVHVSQFYESVGSSLEIGLDGAGVVANGQLNVNGTAEFAGTLDVILENGFQPTIGEQFQLFTFGSESGQFTSLEFPPGYTFDTSQLYGTGVITVTAVPEPVGVGCVVALAATMLCRRERPRNYLQLIR